MANFFLFFFIRFRLDKLIFHFLNSGIGKDSKEKSFWAPVCFVEDPSLVVKKKSLDTLRKKQSVEEQIDSEEIFLCSSGTKTICSFFNQNKTYLWGHFESTEEKQESNLYFPQEVEKCNDFQIANLHSFSSQIVLSVRMQNLPSLKYSSFDPPIIQTGSVQALFDHLFEEPIDYNFQAQFLFTYPSFYIFLIFYFF